MDPVLLFQINPSSGVPIYRQLMDQVRTLIGAGRLTEGAMVPSVRQIAEGLHYGNSPFEYPREFIKGKTLVLTTTNGTRLLQMALDKNAKAIITGSFPNLSAVCNFLLAQKQHVILGCAAWKNRVNIEDTLFAGAVINRIGAHFSINCDSSQMAATMYNDAKADLFQFMKSKNASHYQRLSGYGLEKDIEYCLTEDLANTTVVYEDGKLLAK